MGAAAGPAIVKPNLAELEAVTGRRLRGRRRLPQILGPDRGHRHGPGQRRDGERPAGAQGVGDGDRVALMSPRPGKILEIVDVKLPRPRMPETKLDPRFTECVRMIGRKIGLLYI